MEKLYIVCWGHASTDDDGNCVANCGVVGAYLSQKKAEEALEADLKAFIDSLVDGYDAEDAHEVMESARIYGSVKEGYFEVDYAGAFNTMEYRVEIKEQEAQED
jgi:hypothetical protein